MRAIFAAGTYLERVFPFSTLPPTVEDAKQSLLPTAEAGPDNHITIAWNNVTCGSGYQVFQSGMSSGGAWKPIGNTTALELVVRHVPCRQYGVKVVVDGNLSEVVEAKTTDEKPIKISNLTINPFANSVELSWDHEKCSSGYRIRVCKEGPVNYECFEENVPINETRRNRITKKVENLSPCTRYMVHVFAIINSLQKEGESKSFKTQATKPSPPAIKNSALNIAALGVLVALMFLVAVAVVYAVRKNYFQMMRNNCCPVERRPGDLGSQTAHDYEMEQKTFLGDQNIDLPN